MFNDNIMWINIAQMRHHSLNDVLALIFYSPFGSKAMTIMQQYTTYYLKDLDNTDREGIIDMGAHLQVAHQRE